MDGESWLDLRDWCWVALDDYNEADQVSRVMELTGGCLCGAVRFRVTVKPLLASYCHCTMCQKESGGPFAVFATVPFEGFSFTKGEPAAYEASPGNLRLFCGACGSSVGARVAEDPKLIAINLGCLDDPNLIKPELHAFTSTQVSWCEMGDGLPRHAERAPELAKLWVEMEGWSQPE